MIACLIAGVTSAETFMVTGSALFTRNIVRHLVGPGSHRRDLWIGRAASAGLLGLGIVLALRAASVTQLVLLSVQVIGLLGAAFWLGICWRRANATGVWASIAGGIATWLVFNVDPATYQLKSSDHVGAILAVLAVEFGLMVLVSLYTRPQDRAQLDPFFARLLTPVGHEDEVRKPDAGIEFDAVAGEDMPLDYEKAARFGVASIRRHGIELPRLGLIDWGGFLAAWVMVGALIALLIWLASLGG
jgi:Na+/proline symporter